MKNEKTNEKSHLRPSLLKYQRPNLLLATGLLLAGARAGKDWLPVPAIRERSIKRQHVYTKQTWSRRTRRASGRESDRQRESLPSAREQKTSHRRHLRSDLPRQLDHGSGCPSRRPRRRPRPRGSSSLRVVPAKQPLSEMALDIRLW